MLPAKQFPKLFYRGRFAVPFLCVMLHFMVRVRSFLREFLRSFWNDDLAATSAQLSYYFLFSLFPLLMALVAFLPYLNRYVPVGEAVQDMLARLSTVMPKEGMRLIRERFNPTLVVTQNHGTLLRIGLLVSLWTASRGIDAFRAGLNRVYKAEETRSYIKLQLRAMGLTLAMSLSFIIAFIAIVLGGKLGAWISHKTGVSNAIFAWARWPISTVVLITAVNLCYWLLPNRKDRFHWVDIGSLVATGLWLLASWGFTKYVENFGSYNATYGSIGSVIVLMLWFYLSGFVFLLGAEINATLYTVQQKSILLPSPK